MASIFKKPDVITGKPFVMPELGDVDPEFAKLEAQLHDLNAKKRDIMRFEIEAQRLKLSQWLLSSLNRRGYFGSAPVIFRSDSSDERAFSDIAPLTEALADYVDSHTKVGHQLALL
ncbi:hypothetical protein [Mesorhizobium silamurunense]|uniref:hypothetical protein n=2 Tax=Mesorhizobium silamurunense TaxID=499528 RepID=UPI00177D609A|nr:hypothetical protein [Mesorhizobium silamurunense]